MRQVSKGYNEYRKRECLDADELKKKKTETMPCQNIATVTFVPGMDMQRALMCAIASEDQDLRVDVRELDLDHFQSIESVQCFDKNYKLQLTVLRDVYRDPKTTLPEVRLRCAGGYRVLETA